MYIPQMSPLMWLLLFIYFNSVMLMFMIIIYYFYFPIFEIKEFKNLNYSINFIYKW